MNKEEFNKQLDEFTRESGYDFDKVRKAFAYHMAEAYHQAKLKEESYISFKDWKKMHLIDVNRFENTFLHDTEGWIEEHRLIEKYNDEVMNL